MKYPVCEEHERWGGEGEGRRRGEWRERKERMRKEGEWRKEGEKEKGRREGERKEGGEKGRREGERKGSGENGKKEDGEEKENVYVCTCVKWGGVCGGSCETKTTQYLGVWLTGG